MGCSRSPLYYYYYYYYYKYICLFAAAVRKLLPDATEAAMAGGISSWLTSARDRDGGRQKRAKLKANKVRPTQHDA